MNGGVYPSAILWIVAAFCADRVCACGTFPADGCLEINQCEFACIENRRSLVSYLSSDAAECTNPMTIYALAVTARAKRNNNNCADVLQHAIEENPRINNRCTHAVDNKVETCNHKTWFTHQQTVITTMGTIYVVAINLVAAVLP
jgi:hypothetical protein